MYIEIHCFEDALMEDKIINDERKNVMLIKEQNLAILSIMQKFK